MYVNRLIEFSDSNKDKLPYLGFKQKRVDWIVDFDGESFIFSPLKNRQFFVPDIPRSSNTKPILFADRPDYIFGYFAESKDQKRSEERQLTFKSCLKDYIQWSNDEDAKLLLDALQKKATLPKNIKLTDIIIVRINDELFYHDKPSFIDFWGEHVQADIANESQHFICMFCNKKGPIMNRHTINFLIGPNRTKMISANQNAYESHGLKNSQIAPTCFKCEQNYGKALEYLLLPYKGKGKAGGPHMFRLGDVTYVYWLRNEKQLENSLNMFVSPDEKQTSEDMKDLLNQTFKGIPTNRDVNNFCMLALSSNKARLVVREYIENSIGNIKERIENFFEAQEIGQNRFYGIYTLAATMYREPRNQMQKYAIEEWTNWFLYGRRLSERILISILRLIQSSGTMYPQQGAAIKTWLVSQNDGRAWTVTIDNENMEPAYITGRIFAILERIQRSAIDSDSTIAGKFFGSASTTPRSVMGLLIRNAQHHLNKMRSNPEIAGYANTLEKELGETMLKIDKFPKTLLLEQQAEFSLGYYHQRQKFYTPSKSKKENKK